MKIELNIDSILVKRGPYCLNPRIKEKVKKEIDRMLIDGLIFPVDKAEWISPIMIQTNKGTDDNTIFCGLQKLECFLCT